MALHLAAGGEPGRGHEQEDVLHGGRDGGELPGAGEEEEYTCQVSEILPDLSTFPLLVS